MEREQSSSDMLTRLRSFYARDPIERFTHLLSRSMEDPLVSTTQRWKHRLNPILLLLLALLVLAGATFGFFNLVQ